MMLKVSCLINLLLPVTISAANILILSALPSISHHNWNSVIGEALGDRDHNVTIFSPYLVEKPSKNVHYIFIDSNNSAYEEYTKNVLQSSRKQAFYHLAALAWLTEQMCLAVIESVGFRQLLNYPNNTFDLIIHDFTGGPCLVPFVHKFNYVPLILVTPYSNSPFLANIIGGHQYYAYVPHTVLPFNQTMSFWQRIVNFSFHLMQHFGREYVLLKRLDAIMKKYFGPNLPPISQLEKRATLALVNSDPILDHQGPMLNNVIAIGGMHVKDPKPLPQDLEVFLNSSKKGAVLFSIGSSLHANDLPTEKIQLFMRNLPKNICIKSWMPQSDVLAHSKLKAFITHGGLLSTLEAVWRGVPMIVLPFMFDQNENMNKIKRLQMGESLDYYTLSYDKIKFTLQKVLDESAYISNAKKVSAIVRDYNEKPLDRAIRSIQRVLRSPNVNFSPSPVITLGYIVGNSLDVITFTAIALILQIYIFIKFLYFVYNFFNRKICNAKLHEKQQ